MYNQVPHVEQELPTLPKHMWSRNCLPFRSTCGAGTAHPSEAHVGLVLLDLSFLCNVLKIVVCHFVLFLLAIVLSVLILTVYGYPFDIFELFLNTYTYMHLIVKVRIHWIYMHGSIDISTISLYLICVLTDIVFRCFFLGF